MTKTVLPIICSLMLFSVAVFSQEQTADRTRDMEAIRVAAVAYKNAFDKGDAKSLASLWVADGEYIDQTGLLMRGHSVLEQAFARFFEQNKGVTISITPESTRFLDNDTVSEMGTTQTTTADGKTAVAARYSVIYSRQGDKWVMLSVHEQPPYPPSNYHHLKDLEWLMGQWNDDPQLAKPGMPLTQITGYWSDNRNFIIRDFLSTVDGKVTNSGTQRIGWHAPCQQIRSWAFDSKGSIITGTWSRVGGQWQLASEESLPDGQTVTATEYVVRNVDGSQSWTVTGRTSNGRSLPNESFKLLPAPK